MKLISKLLILFFGTLIFLSIVLLLSFFSIKTNLQTKNNEVNKKWRQLFIISTNKNEKLWTYYSLLNSQPNEKNELILVIETLNVNLKERKKYRDNCSVEYIELEYIINKLILENPIVLDEQFDNELTDLYTLLNEKVDQYNNSVKEFNVYYTLFPNIIVAKHIGLKRKTFFPIKYGVENEEPSQVKVELPEWVVEDTATGHIQE